MQQLALWATSNQQMTNWVGSWYLDSCLSGMPARVGSLALSPAYPLTRWGPPLARSCTPQSLGCVQGCFPSNGDGTLGGWLATPVSDPHPRPARTRFSASGLTQGAASTPYPDVLAPGPPALCRCHWFLGGDVSSLLAGETKVCSRLIPGAGVEVLRLLVNPVGIDQKTWCDLGICQSDPWSQPETRFCILDADPLFWLGASLSGLILYALVSDKTQGTQL
jgi:hypothetical protein